MTRSPRVSFETRQDGRQHDESSFGLYDSSFDAMSDTEGAFGPGNDEPFLSNLSRLQENEGRNINRGDIRGFSAASIPRGSDIPNRNDIEIPDLNSPSNGFGSSDLSLGDLSPIKMIYAEEGAPQVDRHLSQSIALHDEKGTTGLVGWKIETNHVVSGTRSNPFFVLRSARTAFQNMQYLLPCLQSQNFESNAISVSDYGSIRRYRERKDEGEYCDDLKVSTRRVESAICAFGGTLRTDIKQCDDDYLGKRYETSVSQASLTTDILSPTHHSINRLKDEDQHDHYHCGSTDDGSKCNLKVKYRCKRCGQLKQNHVCPDQHILQRSIGIMVYPAVNAYNADEPGVIAPSLSKMNNFISYDDSDHWNDPPSDHVTQQNTTADNGYQVAGQSMIITPESLRGPIRGLANIHFHSPQSSLSAQSAGSDDPISRKDVPSIDNVDKSLLKRSHSQLMESSEVLHPNKSARNAPFVMSLSLRPEQFRAVTPSSKDRTYKVENGTGSMYDAESLLSTPIATTPVPAPIKVPYQYPVIPLSFLERRRLSDTLFHLSQEIPTVTSDCANILRLARQHNEWDIAVAELLTQVVVALYCGEGDLRLDGLQQYLLKLGISC